MPKKKTISETAKKRRQKLLELQTDEEKQRLTARGRGEPERQELAEGRKSPKKAEKYGLKMDKQRREEMMDIDQYRATKKRKRK